MFTIKNIETLYGVLSVALLFFTLIVASTKVYRTRRRFWFTVALAWFIAYLVGSVLFWFVKTDIIFTIMVGSLAGYLVMGDLPFRKKASNEEFEKLESTHEKESAN
jgi:general stress protein CsbA